MADPSIPRSDLHQPPGRNATMQFSDTYDNEVIPNGRDDISATYSSQTSERYRSTAEQLLHPMLPELIGSTLVLLPVLQTSSEHHKRPAIDSPLDRQTTSCGEPKHLQDKESSPFEFCE